VLWLVKGMARGGAETLLLLEARARDRTAIEPRVAYLTPQNHDLVEAVRAEGVPVTCIGSPRALDPRWLWRLRRILAAGDIDLVHVHSPVPAIGARLVRLTIPERVRPRLIGTEHNVWPSHHPVTRLVERLTFGLEDAHLAVSDAVRRSVTARGRDGIEVVLTGVDLEAVRAQADRVGVRAELGLADDEVVVGTVANLRSQKGYPDLLHAAATAIERVGDDRRIVFLAVGKGPMEAELHALHAELGLGDRFRFLGYRDDAVRLMSGLDVFCLASHHEGLPVALMEALALGLPAVATTAGGTPELVTDGVEGLLVPPGRPDRLAEALVAVTTDDARRKDMAGAAALRGDQLSVTRAHHRHEEIYRTVVDGTR
jgi:glycosyltransferase involved in cell wall biosynthesis